MHCSLQSHRILLSHYLQQKHMMGQNLTSKDKEILESIFSPNLTFASEYIRTENEQKGSLVNGHGKVETESDRKARELEVEAVTKAEQGDLEDALTCLNKAVKYCPGSASVFNNRAQLLLLKGEKDAACLDVNKALELSQYEGKVAGQAFTQRALIHKLDGENDAAMKDFQRAARLGNGFAKSQVAQLNPYAALCNQMLAQAIRKLRQGEGDCV